MKPTDELKKPAQEIAFWLGALDELEKRGRREIIDGHQSVVIRRRTEMMVLRSLDSSLDIKKSEMLRQARTDIAAKVAVIDRHWELKWLIGHSPR